MYDVTALGELLIDFAPKSVDAAGYPTLAANPGGAPGNFLAALNKYGCSTAMIGKVGEDMFGHLLLNTLKEAGIETRGVVVDPTQFTTLAFVSLDESGNRDFSFARKPGADTCLNAAEIEPDLIDDTRVFHFGTLSLTNDPARNATHRAVAYAKEKGKLITYDPNLRKPLWKNLDEAKAQMLWGLAQADVVKISDEEVEFLFGMNPQEGAAHILSAYGVKLVFVTCGAQGCYYANKKACGMAESLKGIQVVDTTGAGDIFGGSAVYGLLETGAAPQDLDGDALHRIVRFACTAAGLSTTKHGGISSVPAYEKVMEQVKA